MAGAFVHGDDALVDWANWRATWLSEDGGRVVGLFINDYTPAPGPVIGDLTEPGVPGYARQTIDAGVWSRGQVDHVQILTPPVGVTFTTSDNTGELCYGYFVFYDAAGYIEWIQRFDTPQLLVIGVPISFTPREKLRDCPDE